MSGSLSQSRPRKSSHSLLKTVAEVVLWNSKVAYQGFHFLGEETGSERLSGSPEFTQSSQHSWDEI